MKTQLKLLLCLAFLVSTLLSMPAYAGFTPLSEIKTPQGDEIPLDKEDSDGEFHKGVEDTPVANDCDYNDGAGANAGCSGTVTDPTPATETEEPQAADAENAQEPSDESADSDGADKADESAAADEPDAAVEADEADAEESSDAGDGSDDEE